MTDGVAETAEQERFRLSMSSVSSMASRLSEVVALLAAGLYILGVLRISGELRNLHLSTPTILANFAHTDVLMKGIGVLASHMTSAALMGFALAMIGSRDLTGAVNRVFTHERDLSKWEITAIVLAGIALFLGARWWEGAAFVVIVAIGYCVLWVRQRPVAHLASLGLLAVGLFFVGVVGSYLHTPPLMSSTVEHADAKVEGYLVGKGQDGEWYVAQKGDKGKYQLEVIGGSTQEAARVSIHPAEDQGYRTTFFQITHGWLDMED